MWAKWGPRSFRAGTSRGQPQVTFIQPTLNFVTRLHSVGATASVEVFIPVE
jgi:hypothetical protein